MLIGYARVSTVDQEAGYEAQIQKLQDVGCEEIFQEKISSVGQRDQLEAALSHCRKGDVFCVLNMSRLARNTKQLLEIAERLDKKGVALRILDFAGMEIDTAKATDMLMLTVFAAFSQFERQTMLERQRIGIDKAKAEGKYTGRQPTARAKTADVLALHDKGVKALAIASQLGIGKSSVYRILADR